MKNAPLALTLSALICLSFLGCQSNTAKENSAPPREETTLTDKDSLLNNPAFIGTDQMTTLPEKETTKVVVVAPFIEKSKIPNNSAPKILSCVNADIDVLSAIRHAAVQLSGKKYSRADTTDCSGMFHRVLFAIKRDCPEANLPPFQARSSRMLGRWYYDHGDFTIIRDAANSGDLIEEGAVMFYGHGKKTYDFANMQITDLEKGNTGINHVGIVTQVFKTDGKVTSYALFHGKNPSKRSKVDTLQYRYNANLPAFGNSAEPWLGIAKLFGNAKEEVLQ